MSNYCKNCYELTEKLQAKEQECEQEKALKETYLACYKAKHGDITGKLFKYKQTLAEIKEHFDEECKLCKANYVNITDEICEECETKYMLQKISEVENAR